MIKGGIYIKTTLIYSVVLTNARIILKLMFGMPTPCLKYTKSVRTLD